MVPAATCSRRTQRGGRRRTFATTLPKATAGAAAGASGYTACRARRSRSDCLRPPIASGNTKYDAPRATGNGRRDGSSASAEAARGAATRAPRAHSAPCTRPRTCARNSADGAALRAPPIGYSAHSRTVAESLIDPRGVGLLGVRRRCTETSGNFRGTFGITARRGKRVRPIGSVICKRL